MDKKGQHGTLHNRLGTLGVGVFGKWAMSWIFDFILYPFVISLFGILWGGLMMTVLSFVFCYTLVIFYDGTKKDWLGIETLKSIEDFTPRPIPSNGFQRFMIIIINTMGQFSAWLMKKSDMFLLIILSIKFDPFITVVHIRHGAHRYNGLSKRDWKIFITSLIIGNAYWSFAIFMGISTIEWLWRIVEKLV